MARLNGTSGVIAIPGTLNLARQGHLNDQPCPTTSGALQKPHWPIPIGKSSIRASTEIGWSASDQEWGLTLLGAQWDAFVLYIAISGSTGKAELGLLAVGNSEIT